MVHKSVTTEADERNKSQGHITKRREGSIGVGKSRVTVVPMEKDMQVLTITIALLTQRDNTRINSVSRTHNLKTYFCQLCVHVRKQVAFSL